MRAFINFTNPSLSFSQIIARRLFLCYDMIRVTFFGGEIMKITNKLRKQAVSKIVEFLSARKSGTRNEIIDGTIDLFGLTEEQKNDLSPKGKYNVLKSYLATALNDLLNKKP